MQSSIPSSQVPTYGSISYENDEKGEYVPYSNEPFSPTYNYSSGHTDKGNRYESESSRYNKGGAESTKDDLHHVDDDPYNEEPSSRSYTYSSGHTKRENKPTYYGSSRTNKGSSGSTDDLYSAE